MEALAAGDEEAAAAAEMELAAALLRAQFGPTCIDKDQGVIRVDCDGNIVSVKAATGKAYCADEHLRRRVETAFRRVAEAMKPCRLG